MKTIPNQCKRIYMVTDYDHKCPYGDDIYVGMKFCYAHQSSPDIVGPLTDLNTDDQTLTWTRTKICRQVLGTDSDLEKLWPCVFAQL